jgi:hypothetical protein
MLLANARYRPRADSEITAARLLPQVITKMVKGMSGNSLAEQPAHQPFASRVP